MRKLPRSLELVGGPAHVFGQPMQEASSPPPGDPDSNGDPMDAGACYRVPVPEGARLISSHRHTVVDRSGGVKKPALAVVKGGERGAPPVRTQTQQQSQQPRPHVPPQGKLALATQARPPPVRPSYVPGGSRGGIGNGSGPEGNPKMQHAGGRAVMNGGYVPRAASGPPSMGRLGGRPQQQQQPLSASLHQQQPTASHMPPARTPPVYVKQEPRPIKPDPGGPYAPNRPQLQAVTRRQDGNGNLPLQGAPGRGPVQTAPPPPQSHNTSRPPQVSHQTPASQCVPATAPARPYPPPSQPPVQFRYQPGGPSGPRPLVPAKRPSVPTTSPAGTVPPAGGFPQRQPQQQPPASHEAVILREPPEPPPQPQHMQHQQQSTTSAMHTAQLRTPTSSHTANPDVGRTSSGALGSTSSSSSSLSAAAQQTSPAPPRPLHQQGMAASSSQMLEPQLGIEQDVVRENRELEPTTLDDARRLIEQLKEEIVQRQNAEFDLTMSLSLEEAEQRTLRQDVQRLQHELLLQKHAERLAPRSEDEGSKRKRKDSQDEDPSQGGKESKKAMLSPPAPQVKEEASASTQHSAIQPVVLAEPHVPMSELQPPVPSTPSVLCELSEEVRHLLSDLQPGEQEQLILSEGPVTESTPFWLRLASNLRSKSADSTTASSREVDRKATALCLSVASQLYRSLWSMTMLSGPARPVLDSLARVLQVSPTVNVQRVVAALRVGRYLVSSSTECLEAAFGLRRGRTEGGQQADDKGGRGDGAATTGPSQHPLDQHNARGFASRLRKTKVAPELLRAAHDETLASSDRQQPLRHANLTPTTDAPHSFASSVVDLIGDLAGCLAASRLPGARGQFDYVMAEALTTLTALVERSGGGGAEADALKGNPAWTSLIEDSVLERLVEQLHTHRLVELYDMCIALLQALTVQPVQFERLRGIRDGRFLIDVAYWALDWHLHDNWAATVRRAVDKTSLRTVRFVFCACAKHGLHVVQHFATKRDGETHPPLFSRLILLLEWEVKWLLANQSAPSAATGPHVELVRDSFELFLLLVEKMPSLQQLLEVSRMRWRLDTVNFRLMNKLVHPDLQNLTRFADQLHEAIGANKPIQ